MKIKLDKELKIALLKAVEAGEIETDIFPQRKNEEDMTPAEIATETVRLMKLDSRAKLEAEAILMLDFARNKITDTDYINALIDVWKKEL